MPPSPRRKYWLAALDRNIVAVSGAMFLMQLGEELWRRYAPKYLETLGAPVLAIGLYGSLEDALDGLYQYPGGWIADRYGRRPALLLFVTLAAAGYALYAVAPGWPIVFIALALVAAWSSMASPTLFAVVGDALPKGSRALGFTAQSILRRVPILVAPTLGGMLIAAHGVRGGVRIGLGFSIALAFMTLVVIRRINIPIITGHAPTNILGVWRSLPDSLRWLLASDVFIRTCEGMVDVFLVLYAVNIVGISATRFGLLIGVQMATAIAVYLPAAAVADRIGRKPVVAATFVAFSAFPIAVVLSRAFAGLVLAFIVGGLRELGEPARKALIIDRVEPHLRARSVGLYYLLRSVAIAPAAFVGGLLWRIAPATPFWTAGVIGLAGTALFLFTVSDEHTS